VGREREMAELKQALAATRLLGRDIVKLSLTNELHPLVRKRLTEVVQLLQVYARLAELEIAAGEKTRSGDVSLRKDVLERVREWAEEEEAKVREREALEDGLMPAMESRGYDPKAVRERMSG
jgi:hypothetical protein